jgi:hypothetical protein
MQWRSLFFYGGLATALLGFLFVLVTFFAPGPLPLAGIGLMLLGVVMSGIASANGDRSQSTS